METCNTLCRSFTLAHSDNDVHKPAKEEHSTGATTNLIAKKILCATIII